MPTPAPAHAGLDDAGRNGSAGRRRPAALTPSQVLVLSTGIIGEFLPMDKIAAGITAAAGTTVGRRRRAGRRRPRHADHRHASQAGRPHAEAWAAAAIQITGMAKGAAMIGPNMATMLGLVLTDAPLDVGDGPSAARRGGRSTRSIASASTGT